MFGFLTRHRSLYRQYRNLSILIGLAVALFVVPAIVMSERSSGSGGAINAAGSLRMQSYRLALAVTEPYVEASERAKNVKAEADAFWQRLTSPALTTALREDKSDTVRARYEEVKARFAGEIKESALASVASDAERRRFVEQVDGFVGDVDDFVTALEERLHRRLQILAGILLLTLAGAIGVTVLMIRAMRREIFEPVEALEAALESVKAGRFDVRTDAGDENEIKRLGRGFNYMAQELSVLYGSLEARVKEQTEELERKNRSLEFLRRANERLLASGADPKARIVELMGEAAAFAGAVALGVYLVDAQGGERLFVATPGFTGEAAKRYGWDGRNADAQAEGALAVEFAHEPEAWCENFLSAFAGVLSAALDARLREEDDLRLAVLEERSTIARELHDSIAQSLSFSRIQVLRLKKSLEKGATPQELLKVAAELDLGISSAYSQLREVLTAFRLKPKGAGLAGAIEGVVEESRNRTGLTITVKNRTVGFEASANEQVHLTHLLREALTNIEKHAFATSVDVNLFCDENGALRLQVADNGIGISDSPEKASHFGLSIMRERALALGGELSIRRRPEGGTMVEFRQTRPAAQPEFH